MSGIPVLQEWHDQVPLVQLVLQLPWITADSVCWPWGLIQIFSKWTEYSQIICKKNHEKPHTESVLLSNPQPPTNWASSIISTYLSTLVLQTTPMMQQQTLQHLGAFPARSSIFVYILLLTYQSQRHNKKNTRPSLSNKLCYFVVLMLCTVYFSCCCVEISEIKKRKGGRVHFFFGLEFCRSDENMATGEKGD